MYMYIDVNIHFIIIHKIIYKLFNTYLVAMHFSLIFYTVYMHCLLQLSAIIPVASALAQTPRGPYCLLGSVCVYYNSNSIISIPL